MTYEVERAFAHREHGDIGTAKLAIDAKGKWSLDGKELPDSSVEYLMTFALQSLQDAYAGCKTPDECKGAFEGKRDKIIEGTIGMRTGGAGVDEFTTVARMIVRKAFKDNNPAKSDAREAFMALDAADQNAKLDEWFAANEKAFRPVVEEEVAKRKAERENRAKLAKATSFNI
jgi:hypothetical protein